MKESNLLRLIILLIGLFTYSYAQQVASKNVIPGDGIDNDGDGLIDEEYCYNGIDEDDDGRLNEDCAYVDICPRHGSTTGLEFVTCFLDNQPDDSAFNPLQMFVARMEDATVNNDINVNITTPLLVPFSGSAAIPARTNIRSNIGAGERGKMFDLPYQLRVTDSDVQGTSQKGLHIRVDKRAALHGYNVEKYSADSFLGLPANALGREYFAATFVPSLLNTEVAIVGLYTNTTVNVSLIRDLGEADTPRLMVFFNGVEYENGQSFLVKVSPFDVVLISSEYDMTGTRFTSDLPFTILSGNLRTWVRNDMTEAFIQSRDHLVEQLPPVESWGKRFVTRNYPPHQMADILRVVASKPETAITVKIVNSSGTFDRSFTLKRPGMYRDIWLDRRDRASVVASQPVMVVHYTHSQRSDNVPPGQETDPALIYVPPVDQFDNDYIFASAKYVGTADTIFRNYVLLSTKQGLETTITLDGQRLDGVDWQEVTLAGGDGEDATVTYVQGYLTVDEGTHRLRSRNPFGAIQWSVGDRESVGTALGIRFAKDACGKCKQVICGDHVDNDCDGRIDEERCDGTDSDGDGLVDEDCMCIRGKQQIYRHTTTVTTPPTTTVRAKPTTTTVALGTPPTPLMPGFCTFARSRGDCSAVNVIFIADLLKTRVQENQQLMDGMSNFLQESINYWLPDSNSKFGLLVFSNGQPQINQALTNDRGALSGFVGRRFRLNILSDADSSDLALALQKARTEMFPNGDAGARKVVIVLSFSSYTDRSAVLQIRQESTLLMNELGADVYFIGLSRQRDEISRLAMSPSSIFTDSAFNDWSQFSRQDGTLLPVILSACGDGFQSVRICYNSVQVLTCPASRGVSILSANYGRIGFLGETSCNSANPLNCEADDVACPYVDAYYQIAMACNGQQTCAVTLNSTFVDSLNNIQMPLACRPAATYLAINYICADTISSGIVPPCSYTPATRWLGVSRDMTITASSYASCLSCGAGNQDTCSSGARSQCQPVMGTFDYSAIEAWCPSLNGAQNSWIQADLGAPYIILGVLVQGRRRLTTQYVSELNIQTSNDGTGGFTRVVTSKSTGRQTYLTNSNSTDIAWISLESNRTIARYVRIGVEKYADHPALHFEVVINNRVRGCEAFRGVGTSLSGQRAELGAQRTVKCIGDATTPNGSRSYQTFCQDNGQWSMEVSCRQ